MRGQHGIAWGEQIEVRMMAQFSPEHGAPALAGYTWRPLRVADRPGIATLQAAVAEDLSGPGDRPTDYTPALAGGDVPAVGDAIGAFDATGRLVALGWARITAGVA